MNDEELLALYHWQPGVCFRHPSKGVMPTAHVETIRPLAGGLQDVRACRECVVDMEKRREALAAQSGQAYTPGQLGLLPGSEEA